MKQKFDVTGMTCSACSANVEKSVAKVSGVQDVSVNLLTNSMVVEYDDRATNGGAIISAVENAGYGARPTGQAAIAAPTGENDVVRRARETSTGMRNRLIASVAFMAPLMYIAMGHMLGLPMPSFLHGAGNEMIFAFTQLLLTLPVVYINRHYYQVGFKMLLKGHPNMDSLIAIGSGAALVYGIFAIYMIAYGLGHNRPDLVHAHSMDLYFESAAMILTLITVGKYLEARSKGKTSEALTKLMDLAPRTATVLKDGVEVEIPAAEVAVGDIVIVRPGQSVPADGTILSGNTSIDQSMLTGESMPVEKIIGDSVAAATINKTGYIQFEAKKVGADTSLSQIVRLVEDASATKAPIAKLADRISGIFVPVVISIAVIATVAWLIAGQSVSFALSIGIAVLVISCPCALGLATPVAIMVGTGKGAQLGILFKSAEALERMQAVDTVVLDKTGTVTEGRPRVTDIVPLAGWQERDLLAIAASIERPSEHPLAEAIVAEADGRRLALSDVKQFESETGRGIHASVGNTPYHAGNPAMMRALSIDTAAAEPVIARLAEQGKTPLLFARENEMIGVIGVADVARASSAQAIERFKALGLSVVMLTGDNAVTAEAIRKELNIDRAIADVLPQDKEREVRALMDAGKKVAMIGDGINDAPALARADVGVAIGAGTDIAIESADVVLMKSDLNDAVNAIELSRAVMRNIRQNLFWAFFYNTIGIPLAAGVFYTLLGWKLDPMIGAAAMSLSSVSVVTNALRLRWFKPSSAVQPDGAQIAQKEKTEEFSMKTMEKVLTVDGMMCAHCQSRVEKVLAGLPGVTSATVDLEAKTATVAMSEMVSDDALKQAVEGAGYDVVSIESR